MEATLYKSSFSWCKNHLLIFEARVKFWIIRNMIRNQIQIRIKKGGSSLLKILDPYPILWHPFLPNGMITLIEDREKYRKLNTKRISPNSKVFIEGNEKNKSNFILKAIRKPIWGTINFGVKDGHTSPLGKHYPKNNIHATHEWGSMNDFASLEYNITP